MAVVDIGAIHSTRFLSCSARQVIRCCLKSMSSHRKPTIQSEYLGIAKGELSDRYGWRSIVQKSSPVAAEGAGCCPP